MLVAALRCPTTAAHVSRLPCVTAPAITARATGTYTAYKKTRTYQT